MRGVRIPAFLAFCSCLVVPRLTLHAATVDPCSLLTVAEVDAVVGIKSLPGRPYLGSKDICLFSADTSSFSDQPVVNLMVHDLVVFQGQKNMGPHPLSGLGDEAYWIGSGSYAKVEVRKGSRAFSVSIAMGKVSKTSQQIEQMEEALAHKVLARF